MRSYKTNGTCSREIKYKIKDDIIEEVEFVSGCPGNLLGIATLVKGMHIDKVIEQFKGLPCGSRPTSCPDQLAKALLEYKQEQSEELSA